MYTPNAALESAASSSPSSYRNHRVLGTGLALQTPTAILVDLGLLSVALLTVIFKAPIAENQHNFRQVLALRISLENLLMAAICIAVWSIFLGPDLVTGDGPRVKQLLLGLLAKVTACTALVALLLSVRRPQLLNPESLALFFCGSFSLLLSGHFITSVYRSTIMPAIRRERMAVIVGSWGRGQQAAEQLRNHPKWNYKLLGFIESHPSSDEPVLGPVESLESVLMHNPVEEVIIALPVKSMYDDIQHVIATCERLGIQSRYSSDLFKTKITKKRSVDMHDPSSVLLHMVHTDVRQVLKRAVDVIVAGFSLVFLSPLLLIIAICIKATSKGPVLFRQERYGLNKRLFTLYKFRSMVVDAEERQGSLEHLNEVAGPVFKIRSDPRITGIGDFLRKSSLDELPQLWNVLIGDMSLVGPRPLPMRDVSRFSEAWLMRRFSVPPGITGLWQVSGRSNTNFEQWIALDLHYIDRWSLYLDLKIIARTLPAVFKREGAV